MGPGGLCLLGFPFRLAFLAGPGKILARRSLAARFGLWSGVTFTSLARSIYFTSDCARSGRIDFFPIVTMAGTAVGRETTVRVCLPDAVGKLHGWRPTKS